MSNMSSEQKVKIYKASKVLQEKAGTGSVSPQKIEEAEKIIENNTVNFIPMANDYLSDLEGIIKLAHQGQENPDNLLHYITLPIMQMKATGSIFGYQLVGDLSASILNFLETIKTVDDDVIAIIEALHAALTLIIRDEIVLDGGQHGTAMRNELNDVCERYLAKHGKTS